MRPIYVIISTLILYVFYIANIKAQATSITQADLKRFVGDWQGNLTYMDYTSNLPYTMPANIDIEQIEPNVLLFMYFYPGEPNSNIVDTLIVHDGGKMINDEEVISIRKLERGDTEIITEKSGVDGNDNKKARIRHTYTVGKNTLILNKDIKFVGQKKWINRHQYNWIKI